MAQTDCNWPRIDFFSAIKNGDKITELQWTTRITETGITNLTRITNEMATSSDYT